MNEHYYREGPKLGCNYEEEGWVCSAEPSHEIHLKPTGPAPVPARLTMSSEAKSANFDDLLNRARAFVACIHGEHAEGLVEEIDRYFASALGDRLAPLARPDDAMAVDVARRVVSKFPQLEPLVIAPMLTREIAIAFISFAEAFRERITVLTQQNAILKQTEPTKCCTCHIGPGVCALHNPLPATGSKE